MAAMAKAKRKAAPTEPENSGVETAYTLWRNGDVKGARSMARGLLGGSPNDVDRASLERLITDTSPDPRAVQVAVFCLAVATCVVLLTKFFG
jgi:hypothetical protein